MKKLNFAKLLSPFVVLFLFAGSCNNERNVFPEAIITKEGTKTIKDGETFKFEYEVRPSNAKGYSILFSSSNENVATVDRDGKITGMNVGNASITALLEGRSVVKTSIVVTVEKGIFAIESLSYDNISPQPYQIHIGDAKQLIPTIIPEKATPSIEYSSSDIEVASINTSGNVSAKKVGTCTITATAKENREIVASIELEILPKRIPVTNINAPDRIQTLFSAGAIKIEEKGVRPSPSNAYPYKFEYELADNTLAQIDQETGTLTPLKSGETKLKITDRTTNVERTKETNLVIVEPITAFTNNVVTTVEQGKTVPINYQTTPEESYGYLLNFSYANSADNDKITLNSTSTVNKTPVTVTAIANVKNSDNSPKYIAPGRFKIKIEDKSSIAATSHLYNGTAVTEAIISVIPSNDDNFEVVFEDDGVSNKLKNHLCGAPRCTLHISKAKIETQVQISYEGNKYRDLGGLEYFKGLKVLNASGQNWRAEVNLVYFSPTLEYVDFSSNDTPFTKFYMTQEQKDKLSTTQEEGKLYLLDHTGSPVSSSDPRIEIREI